MAEDRHFTVEQSESLQYLRDAIDMDRGDFSLIFAHCSYRFLRDRLIDELIETSEFNLEIIDLQPETTSLLDALTLTCDGTWKADGTQRMNGKTYSDDADGLIIRGFERVENLPELFRAINQVRESLKRGFPLPMVFWITPDVLKEIMNSAPDLESWAIGVDFPIVIEQITSYVTTTIDQYFQITLDENPFAFFSRSETKLLEKEITVIETKAREKLPDRDKMYVEILWGIACNRNYNSPEAIKHFSKALEYCSEDDHLFRGRIFHQLSMGYYFLAYEEHNYVQFLSPQTFQKLVIKQREKDSEWQIAYSYIEKTLDEWQNLSKINLVWAFSTWEGLLRNLQFWEDIERFTRLSFDYLQDYPTRLTRNFTFLAECLEAQGKYTEAEYWARKATSEEQEGYYRPPHYAFGIC